jgi:hypothetical protein
MSECNTDKKNSELLGGVEVHVKFTRYQGDFGIQLDFTPTAGSDGAPQGNNEINNALAGLCRATVMEMDGEARLRLLALVEQDGGNDRMLYRLAVTSREADDGVPEIRVEDRIDPAFSRLDPGAAGRAARCRAEIERLLAGKDGDVEYESEEMFEILEKMNYPPAVQEHTEEEARRGMLEGEEFLLLEIQVIGAFERYRGKESLAFDYIAAMSEKALSSEWMKEKIRLISKVCENTVMGIDKPTTRHLAASIRRTEARELCLYRLSVWCSMNDDGSPRYQIRDTIDPAFSRHDPAAGKRAEETRRLAALIMEGTGA